MSVRKEVSGNDEEQFLVTDWDQNMKFSGSTSFSTYNVDSSNIVDRLPSFSGFGSESLSEIMSSFGIPENTQIQEFASTNDDAVEKNLKGKKRKKSFVCGDQSAEVEKQNDVPNEIAKNSSEKDEKKQKNEVNPSVKENGDALKDEYFVHVRAKRGQATNSHSLAERVRREKISERMKLLQDLVPGCNKITGKAVMLDEIINYVQSLQKQVEFLSMKLATVNPEFDMDIEQIFSKENALSKYGNSPFLGYSHPQMQPGMIISSLQNSRDFLRIATKPQISSMAQVSNPWDNEFQNAIQMGLFPNLPNEEMELNGDGSMKVEL